jgi:hypothetical protein
VAEKEARRREWKRRGQADLAHALLMIRTRGGNFWCRGFFDGSGF